MFVVVAVHMCVFQGVGFQDTIPEGTLARSPENMPRAKVKHFSGSQCSTHKTYTATDVEACTSGHIHIHVTWPSTIMEHLKRCFSCSSNTPPVPDFLFSSIQVTAPVPYSSILFLLPLHFGFVNEVLLVQEQIMNNAATLPCFCSHIWITSEVCVRMLSWLEAFVLRWIREERLPLGLCCNIKVH